MYLTSILGKLNYPASRTEQANGWMSMILQRIDGIGVGATGPFNFAGTGTSSSNDASITDYSIKPATGLDVSSFTTNLMPLRMKGFMKAFGSAPEDFDAQTIMDLSNTNAFLNVGWGGVGRLESEVFTNAGNLSSGLTLSGSAMSSYGYFHRVNRGGDITDFVNDYPGQNPVVQADGASTDKFIIDQAGTITVYTTYSNFVTALNTATAAGAKIIHLYGWGKFSDTSLTFSAQRILIVVR
jgi:hypothetical protein